MGWQVVENVGIGGSFSQPDNKGRVSLSAFAGSGERGEVMRKMLFLEPGNYRFQARYSALEAVSDAEIRWDMQCINTEGNVGNGLSTPRAQGQICAIAGFQYWK